MTTRLWPQLYRSTALLLCTAPFAAAQLGSPAGSSTSGSTSAVQLPLSGRTSQTGSVGVQQTPVPGTTSSVNTINTNVQVQGPYGGSVPSGDLSAQPVTLSFRDAIQRGLNYNLGAVGLSNTVRQARGQATVARSGLLPNLNGNLRENIQQTNLQALGVRIPFAPSIVGPFNYFDLRATLTQTVADLTVLNNYRAAQETARATELAAKDARDLVVLAVGGAYLQVIASAARVESAKAQVSTAQAVLDQAQERFKVGFNARIDVNRTQVQLQTQQQRLASLENDLAKQRLNLARLVGLPLGQAFTLADAIPYSPAPEVSLPQALSRARENRYDLQSAEAQVRAAERAQKAARAERLPSLAFSADYGAIGINPSQAHGTFTVTGTLRFPIWQGGRTEGQIQQAVAVLEQRRAERSDLVGRIDADVRNAFYDMETAANQVRVAESNRRLASENLTLARERYQAGIADAVEVVQAQESIATAEQDYISSVFAHNLGKMSFARALGRAEDSVLQILQVP